MTIDLKWGLPLYASTGFIFLVKWSAFLSGVEFGPVGRELTVFFAIATGAVGVLFMTMMHVEGVRWNVTIGGRKND